MDSQMLVPALLIASVLLAAIILFVLPRWRERRLLSRPFPAAWQQMLQRQFPLYGQLSTSEQEILRGLIRLFLGSKTFYGCGGLRMTDEIRVSIAAQASLLMIH